MVSFFFNKGNWNLSVLFTFLKNKLTLIFKVISLFFCILLISPLIFMISFFLHTLYVFSSNVLTSSWRHLRSLILDLLF